MAKAKSKPAQAEPEAGELRPSDEPEITVEEIAASVVVTDSDDPLQPYSAPVQAWRKELKAQGVIGEAQDAEVLARWRGRHEVARLEAEAEMKRAAQREADVLAEAEHEAKQRALAAETAQAQAIADVAHAAAIAADPVDPSSLLAIEAQRNLRAQGLSGAARERAVAELWLARTK